MAVVATTPRPSRVGVHVSTRHFELPPLAVSRNDPPKLFVVVDVIVVVTVKSERREEGRRRECLHTFYELDCI